MQYHIHKPFLCDKKNVYIFNSSLRLSLIQMLFPHASKTTRTLLMVIFSDSAPVSSTATEDIVQLSSIWEAVV